MGASPCRELGHQRGLEGSPALLTTCYISYR